MSPAEDRFGELAKGAIAEGAFPGAVLRVEGRSALLFEGAWGDALFAEGDRVPMAVSTIFDLASVSKLFTTTAVLRLASLGELSLSETVASLYRRLYAGRDAEEGVLVRLQASLKKIDVADLLSHASGIHYWHPFYIERARSFEEQLADVLEAHPPNGEVVYSDLNFMILGRLVETLAARPLPDAMHSLVFEPLGLARTSYRGPLGPAASTEFGNRIERKMVANLGLSFDGWRDESAPISGEPDDGNCFYFFRGAAGHAGVFSDARDLCALGRLYLDGGRTARGAFLDPELASAALRERRGGRGLGFQLGENYPGGGSGHAGFTGSYLYVSRKAGLVIALLTNRLHEERPRDINPVRRRFSETALELFA